MKHIAAYLLAAIAGNEKPTAADVTKILDSVGIQADEARLNKLIEELKGKSLDEVLAAGEALLATAPAAGAAKSGSASGSASGSGSGSGSGSASGSGSSSSSGSDDGKGKKAGFSLF